MLLGQNTEGEVRVLSFGRRRTRDGDGDGVDGAEPPTAPKRAAERDDSPQLRRLLAWADEYDRDMNIYTKHCRVFTARAQRKVDRLNLELEKSAASQGAEGLWLQEAAAELRFAKEMVSATALPLIFPVGVAGLLLGT